MEIYSKLLNQKGEVVMSSELIPTMVINKKEQEPPYRVIDLKFKDNEITSKAEFGQYIKVKGLYLGNDITFEGIIKNINGNEITIDIDIVGDKENNGNLGGKY